ncbi:MAG: cytochrome C [Sulfurimonas sp.]|uniref:cytochrome C n=1 Tax=Sulfurimonas sp. TaxID=2022749 RepID=UPI00262994CA|nr:cytochrome C [Sulfurimonas sp.]MDD2652516.1 cytochrome C [Sulfurimonas sp.]MDD3451309.1 cytochrome C [Sulfurimonas sp.]
MNKLLIFVVSLSVFTLCSLDAAAYKGQSVYAKKCVKCHKGGQSFVSSKKAMEWNAIMKNEGEKLANLHLKSQNPDAKPSHEYFESGNFTKTANHLKDFLMEYAGDSGNVPACN